MSKWVSVEDRLPKAHKVVIATFKNERGNSRTVCGYYIRRFETVSEGEDGFEEYCEEKDEYFCCEGWYENIENWDEYTAVHVSEGKITHWMPLPEPPSDEGDDDE